MRNLGRPLVRPRACDKSLMVNVTQSAAREACGQGVTSGPRARHTTSAASYASNKNIGCNLPGSKQTNLLRHGKQDTPVVQAEPASSSARETRVFLYPLCKGPPACRPKTTVSIVSIISISDVSKVPPPNSDFSQK